MRDRWDELQKGAPRGYINTADGTSWPETAHGIAFHGLREHCIANGRSVVGPAPQRPQWGYRKSDEGPRRFA